jgi:hypothetical protein
MTTVGIPAAAVCAMGRVDLGDRVRAFSTDGESGFPGTSRYT